MSSDQHHAPLKVLTLRDSTHRHRHEQLLQDLEEHRRTLIDPYGASNPAEFFAVVTESFFEQPRQLRAKHPELYDQLRGFYQQDPASAPELGPLDR